MQGAVLVAIAAAIGNLLQGLDNAAIAAAVLYIKREFHLETDPALEGERGAHGGQGARAAFNGLRGRVLLLLRHGVRAHPQHPMRGDLPHACQGDLHRRVLPHLLDLRHHRHQLSPCDAQNHRPRGCIWLLRLRLLLVARLRVPQGARDQGVPARGHNRVLQRGCQSSEAGAA
ncbi:Monosaccharide-sensing protein 2 [Zea mays]|uniref:Monosaccharide-sensing protein 2 n=1 Tax=Zea mays TaxID=4577 RepID=A0A1D6GWX2_MAIZE|nr:Monosaccharide-sensing protein 2 [Zea mays]